MYQFISVSVGRQCGDITSFGPEAVFAIHYDNWKWFFQPQKKSEVMDAIHSSFATHVWGHFFKWGPTMLYIVNGDSLGKLKD